MTYTQKNALKIVIEAVVNGASNGYTVKVDDIVTIIEGIIEKETQFGIYPHTADLNKSHSQKPHPDMDNPILWDQMADQIVYPYTSTSTADVNSGENQMICETK